MLFFETSLFTGRKVFLDLIEGAGVGVDDDAVTICGDATDGALPTTPTEVSLAGESRFPPPPRRREGEEEEAAAEAAAGVATEIISISADCDSAVGVAIVGVVDSRIVVVVVEGNGEFLNAAMVVSGVDGGGSGGLDDSSSSSTTTTGGWSGEVGRERTKEGEEGRGSGEEPGDEKWAVTAPGDESNAEREGRDCDV